MYNVTRQTVSNWENEKSYPDLSTLVKISDEFNVSLDILLKGDFRMVKDIDKKIKKPAILYRNYNRFSHYCCCFIFLYLCQ